MGHLYPSLCVRGLGRPPKKSVIEVCWDIIGGTNLRKRAVSILGDFFSMPRQNSVRCNTNRDQLSSNSKERRKRISKAADRVTRKLSLFWVLWNVAAFHRVLLGAIWWKSVRFDLKPQWRRWLFSPHDFSSHFRLVVPELTDVFPISSFFWLRPNCCECILATILILSLIFSSAIKLPVAVSWLCLPGERSKDCR